MRDIWLDQGTPPRRHENAPIIRLSNGTKPVPPLKRALSNEEVPTVPRRHENAPTRRWDGTPTEQDFMDWFREGDTPFPLPPLGRPDETRDPVRRATRERIRAWLDGEAGCV